MIMIRWNIIVMTSYYKSITIIRHEMNFSNRMHTQKSSLLYSTSPYIHLKLQSNIQLAWIMMNEENEKFFSFSLVLHFHSPHTHKWRTFFCVWLNHNDNETLSGWTLHIFLTQMSHSVSAFDNGKKSFQQFHKIAILCFQKRTRQKL
jgi:hypothetical protein